MAKSSSAPARLAIRTLHDRVVRERDVHAVAVSSAEDDEPGRYL